MICLGLFAGVAGLGLAIEYVKYADSSIYEKIHLIYSLSFRLKMVQYLEIICKVIFA